MTDEIALVRHLAGRGRRIGFLDGSQLLATKMHDSGAETWDEWGRSLALPGVTTPGWQAADQAVVWLCQAAPLPLLGLALASRGRPGGPGGALVGLNAGLLALRLALLGAVAGSYERRGPWFWLSPLADQAAAARLLQSALRPTRSWRGRTYARPD